MPDAPSFADIPPTVARVMGTGEAGPALPGIAGRWERVLLVMLDGLGWRGVERFAEHPFFARVREEGLLLELATQFPSTTTAHVTTLHTGLPVGAHGLYEWHVLEPSLGRIIRPLPFAFDGHAAPDSLLASGLRPEALLPDGPTQYERLAAAGVGCTVHQPAAFSPSTFDRPATRGAELRPQERLADGLTDAAAQLARGGPRFAYVYDDKVDGTGHLRGPSSAAFDHVAKDRLTLVDGLARGLRDTLVLVCADHGQDAVDPQRVDYLDELWPPLLDALDRGADGEPLGPAGSSRDVFLHVREDAVDAAVAALRGVLGERAEVEPAAALAERGLFGDVGPRLRERLATVCVLPAAGRQAWLRRWAGVEQVFRGHHGGLTPDEARTFLAALPT